MNLNWEDIDFERKNRNQKEQDSQSYGQKNQEIVLPAQVMFQLLTLAYSIRLGGSLPGPERTAFVAKGAAKPKGRIFVYEDGSPMTGDAFSDAFDAAVKRAEIEDMVLRDLRQTATTMFIRAGLTPEERQIMKRETNKTMDARHYQGEKSRTLHLERIQDKLDIYQLGKTLAELQKENAEHQREFESYCEEGLQEGFGRDAAIQKAKARMLQSIATTRKLTLSSLRYHRHKPA